MMGEVARAAAGVEIKEINKVLDKVVGSYEKNYATAPGGKPFQNCYDVATCKPTEEHLKIYEQAKKKLAGFGLNFTY
jgi:methylamine--corrinoid protein Co-methyltransferase